jgi:hypothetical protein
MISMPLKCLFLAGLCCYGAEGSTRGTCGVRSCSSRLISNIYGDVTKNFKVIGQDMQTKETISATRSWCLHVEHSHLVC